MDVNYLIIFKTIYILKVNAVNFTFFGVRDLFTFRLCMIVSTSCQRSTLLRAFKRRIGNNLVRKRFRS